MIKAVRAIVHKNSDAEGAYNILLKEKEKETQQHRIIKSVD
jgi:hypothetical protein